MKKSTITALLFAFASNASAQDMEVGIQISPDYAFRHLSSKYESSTDNYQMEVRNFFEKPVFTYTAGGSFRYHLSNRFFVETGVLYSQKGFQQDDVLFIYNENGVETQGNGKLTTYFRTLDVPLLFNAQFGEQNLKLVTSTGFTPSFFVQARNKAVYYFDRDPATYPTFDVPNKVWISAEAGVGINYSMGEKWSLSAMPKFRYGLTSAIPGTLQTRPWSAGLAVSCFYKL